MRPATGVIGRTAAQHLTRLTVTEPTREAAPGWRRAAANVAVGEIPDTPAAPAVAAAVRVAMAAAKMVLLLLTPSGGLRVELPLPRLVVPVPSMAPSGHKRTERAPHEVPLQTLDPYQNLEKFGGGSDQDGVRI